MIPRSGIRKDANKSRVLNTNEDSTDLANMGGSPSLKGVGARGNHGRALDLVHNPRQFSNLVPFDVLRYQNGSFEVIIGVSTMVVPDRLYNRDPECHAHMPTAQQILALVKSHVRGDDERFYSLVLQLAAA
jgi:hypothetical protein